MNLAERINLSKASVLVADGGQLSLEILSQILKGFGVGSIWKATTGDAARRTATSHPFDVIIVDANLPPTDGFDFVSWLRRSNLKPNCYAPVLMVSSHPQRSKIAKSRDCGANIVVAKPLTPITVMERIVWLAKEPREFLETATYAGPDRRFRHEGPPEGLAGRRATDQNPVEDDLSLAVNA